MDLGQKQLPQVNQSVQSCAGWLSVTSDKQVLSEYEPGDSIATYMPPVLFQITENATVQHVLELSEKATQSVGQEYTIVTFDVGVEKKAFNIVWQNHVKFGRVIVRIGVFHTICSLLVLLVNILTLNRPGGAESAHRLVLPSAVLKR